MLRFLRRGAKSLVAKILIALLVGSFAIWGIGDIFRLRLDSRIASVGDTDIEAQSFMTALEREQARLVRQSGQAISFDVMRAAGIDQRVLHGLVRDAAFSEELNHMGIAAPDSEVAKSIQNNPNFQGADGKFSAPDYNLLLARQGLSASQFEALTRTLLGQQVLVESAEASALPLPGASARIAAWQGEERTAAALTLTLDMAPAPGTPDETALQEFYDANHAMFTEPERRWARYVHADAKKLLAELRPDDATLREHYDAEKSRYTTPPTRTVEQITVPDRAAGEAAMVQLVSGDKTFDALAADRGVMREDLSLGKVTREDLPEAAAAAVFGATEPGIIGPVELPAGFAIYRVVEIDPGSTKSFDEVKDQIADRLAADALVTRAPEVANRIEELRAEGQSLEEIAKNAGVDFGEADGIARDGSFAGGGKAEGFEANSSFLDEVFQALDHEERDLVETKAGGYFLVVVDRIEPSALHTLDEVRDRAITAWQIHQRSKEIEAKGTALAARLGTDASIWDLADELGTTAAAIPAFTRATVPPAVPAPLAEKLFALPTGRGASAPTTDGLQVVVAQVTGITPLAPDMIALQSTRIDGALGESLKKDLGEYFARAVEARYPVTLEPKTIDQVFQRLGAISPGAQ